MYSSTQPLPTGQTLPKKKKIRKLKPSQIIKKERTFIELEGDLGAALGKIEPGTKIIIRGRSYGGKSSLMAKLILAFSHHMKCDYNNHEEKGGDAATVKNKLALAGIDKTHDGKVRFYKADLQSAHEETFDDILDKKASAGFVVLDSMQHAKMDKKEYIRFTNKYCNPRRGKIAAFVCHNVKNDFTNHVWHDCDIKLETIGYICNVESRMEGASNKPIIIWEEGAKKYWGKKYTSVVNGKYWPGQKK